MLPLHLLTAEADELSNSAEAGLKQSPHAELLLGALGSIEEVVSFLAVAAPALLDDCKDLAPTGH